MNIISLFSRSIIATEGVLALYRGMAGMIYLALPRFAIAFHGNAFGKNLYSDFFSTSKDPSVLNYPEILFGGLFSQLFIVPGLVTPLERVKILMQTDIRTCLLYTSPSPRDRQKSRMPSSA